MLNKDIKFLVAITLIILSIFFTSKEIFAEHYFHLDYIGFEQGLEDSSVEKIIQDDEGYIWFGTQAGLYKYDGRTAKKYKSDGKDGSLISDNIYDLLITKNNKLWVATLSSGIAIYDKKPDTFRIISNNTVPRLRHYRARSLIEYRDDVLVLSDVGMEKVNQNNLAVDTIAMLNPDERLITDFSARYLEKFDNKVYTVINKRIYYFDYKEKLLRQYDFSDFKTYAYTSDTEHYALFSDKGKNLFIYTSDGLFKVNNQSKKILKEPLGTHETRETRLRIEDVYEDSYGTTWIVTRGQGVYFKLPGHNKYSSMPVGVGKNQLNTDQVFTIFEDKTNNIWLGTDGFYAAKFRTPQVAFPFYSNFYASDRSEHTNVIWTFEEFSDAVYLGTDNGLFKLIPDGDESAIKPVINSEKYRVTYDLLNAGNQMYIGGLNGLNSLLETGETRNYNYLISQAMQNNVTSDNTVTQLAQSDKYLYIGTFNGLVAIEKETERSIYYNHENGDYKIHNGVIMSLAYDEKRKLLWIGSETGLEVISSSLDEKANAISNIVKNVSGFVNDIHVDQTGHVWIAVEKNLFRFTPENTLLEYHHFPNEEIRAIETVNNTIWMTTPTGMLKASIDKLEDYTYFIQEDGLYNTGNTTMGSMYLPKTNELLFGGDKGFIRFNSNIKIPVKDAIAPKMNVVRLTNSEGQPDILERIQNVGSLEFFENSLRFEFAHLDFKAPKKTRFQHQLEGFDRTWSALSNENSASYTNLRSGDYVFRVKVYDANNTLSDKELAIHFSIKTAWWRSDFAYFLYFVALLSGVLAMFSWYKADQARVKKLQIQRNKEEFISGYNRYALSLTELQSHQTLVRKFLDQIKLISGAEYLRYKQFIHESIMDINIGVSKQGNLLNREIELSAKDTIAQLYLEANDEPVLNAVSADIQILFQQMIILQNALIDKQKYNWNDYYSSVTGLYNRKAFKNILRDEIERAEINNLSLNFYEWNIEKIQFKENELLKRIQLLSYGDKIKDVFGAHVIATFSENFNELSKFIILLVEENSESITKYKSEFENAISEMNDENILYEGEIISLCKLHAEFSSYLEKI